MTKEFIKLLTILVCIALAIFCFYVSYLSFVSDKYFLFFFNFVGGICWLNLISNFFEKIEIYFKNKYLKENNNDKS